MTIIVLFIVGVSILSAIVIYGENNYPKDNTFFVDPPDYL